MPESLAVKRLHIGALVFPRMDQADFTGPFEVLSRFLNPLPAQAGIDPLNKLIDRNPDDNVIRVEKQ